MPFTSYQQQKYTTVRKAINAHMDMYEIIHKYAPQVKRTDYRINSILNEHDKNPSFTVNYVRRIWKCFSTGKGGGYLELLYWTHVLRDHGTKSIMQLANEILVHNSDIQLAVGFSSLLKTETLSEIHPQYRSSIPAKVNLVGLGLTAISKNLLDKPNISSFLRMLNDFELSMPVDELCSKYANANYSVTKTQLQSFEDVINQILGDA